MDYCDLETANEIMVQSCSLVEPSTSSNELDRKRAEYGGLSDLTHGVYLADQMPIFGSLL